MTGGRTPACTGGIEKAVYKGHACLRVSMRTDRLPPGFDAQMLRKVRHPHIAKIYDVEEGERQIILWEEYIKGCTLTDLCKRVLPDRRRIKSVLCQTGSAVSYLHAMKPKQIVHGDIKPGNIMINMWGQVKLIDFSAAQMIEGEGMPGVRYGTPYFTAPEVYLGEPGSMSQDIYGIGATLLYMLRGETILRAADLEKAVLCEKGSDIGERLALLRIAYRCIRQEPHLRYQTVEELLRDIKPSLWRRQYQGE